jgi:hypothetical protein
VRRLTRRATAARAQTTLAARLSDAWGGSVSAAIGVAVAGGSLVSLREEVALAGAPVTGTTLPASLTSAALAVLALAGTVVVLARWARSAPHRRPPRGGCRCQPTGAVCCGGSCCG